MKTKNNRQIKIKQIRDSRMKVYSLIHAGSRDMTILNIQGVPKKNPQFNRLL